MRSTMSAFDRHAWRIEVRALLVLAGPLVLTQLGQVAIQTTDVIMIGWLGPDALAAASLGVSAVFVLLIFGIGVVSATAPMIAHDLGRRRFAVREPRRTVRQGFWVALALGLPACVLLWHLAPVLGLLQQDPALIAATEPYVRAALFGFIPALWAIGLRNFLAALERPRAGMIVMFAGIIFNAAADYALIFGAFGLPALGLLGAGIATAATNIAQFVVLLLWIQLDRRFRRYRLLGRLWRPDWPRLREILRIGLPIGVTLTLEVGLFASAVYLIGLIGTAALAAHMIALQVASVTFMVPLGLGQAATVRVGLASGRADPRAAWRAGMGALAMGTAFMAAMAVVMWTTPETIIAIFLDLDDPAAAPVVDLAIAFLAVAALFQIVDGGQAIGAGALRGLKDTRWPMAFAAIGYWPIGLGTGVLLAFGFDLGGVGIWIGFAAGLATAAVLMTGRFVLLARTAMRGPALSPVPARLAI